jgi:p-hydroxybenzoate 3-monooxygenase
VDTLVEAGLGARLLREGLAHDGLELRFDGGSHRIDLQGLTGKRVTIYGQQEAVKDMVAARLATGRPLHFEVRGCRVARLRHRTSRASPGAKDGIAQELHCDVIAGCDGFHGPSREAMPPEVLRLYERVYPFAWLGILAEAPPISHELIYARHADGFALATMRSNILSRLYLQCAPDEDLARWPDDRIWEALQARLDAVNRGKIVQKGVTAMRSFVAEPMRHGRLFLAGDAAHIVPPTGAKGMNLAVADVRVLAAALTAFYRPRRHRPDGPLQRDLPQARLEGAALLLVDDLDAPPLQRRRPLRASRAGRRARLPRSLRGRADGAGRAIRGTAL